MSIPIFSQRTELLLFCVRGCYATSRGRQAHFCPLPGHLGLGQKHRGLQFAHGFRAAGMGENADQVLRGDARTWTSMVKEDMQKRKELCLGLKGIRKGESARLDLVGHLSQ